MGACDFYAVANGANAKEAFDRATSDARYERGHGGYTGTIAEKREFVMIPLPEGAEPLIEARRLISEGDDRVLDKRGPAGCFHLGEDHFAFFGVASS